VPVSGHIDRKIHGLGPIRCIGANSSVSDAVVPRLKISLYSPGGPMAAGLFSVSGALDSPTVRASMSGRAISFSFGPSRGAVDYALMVAG
jgi:hypothetical protein